MMASTPPITSQTIVAAKRPRVKPEVIRKMIPAMRPPAQAIKSKVRERAEGPAFVLSFFISGH